MRIPQFALLALCFPTTHALSTGYKMHRRSFLVSAASLLTASQAVAAETIGKDPNCNDRACLGVWDGLLADCPHIISTVPMMGGAGCVASQDDTPGIFAEPWDYGDLESIRYEDQMRRLVLAIQTVSSKRRDDVDILQQEGRYLRVRFRDGNTSESSIGEFYFTPNDTTVQFRVEAVQGTAILSLRNQVRCELIRKQMGYLKLPVLRNRKQAFFFGESDLDTFGPGSAALGPPAEMATGELEGRQDVDPKLKIDFLQQFPVSKPSR
jgi:hypothetical protein